MSEENDERNGSHFLGVLQLEVDKLNKLTKEFDPDRCLTQFAELITEEGP